MTIKIPRAFYEDHRDRGLPTPMAAKWAKEYVWIDPKDADLDELVADAKVYATPNVGRLRLNALALLEALSAAGIHV